MKLQITHRFDSSKVLFEGDADSILALLKMAILSGADLSGAYLSGAYLSGAYLSGADLSGADLSGAIINHEKENTLKTPTTSKGRS
jgi:uncharacterized protein YjbI with pentapeptide repeats